MTSPDVDILNEYEFDIGCELCDDSAYVMTRGCADDRFYALCVKHYTLQRRLFRQYGNMVCTVCGHQWLYYDTHFRVVVL